MIKNIISDIGNVLFKFDVIDFLYKHTDKVDDVNEFLDNTIRDKNWSLMDKGDLSFNDAKNYFLNACPKYKFILKQIFDSYLTDVLSMHHNIEILKEYKLKGYNIYYLSNMPIETFNAIRKKTDFFDNICSGGIISADVKIIKPTKAIYELLLKRYKLNTKECLFIDDNLDNVVSAEKIGIKSIHLKNIDDLSLELKNIEYYENN